ncbi:MAG: DMT family transporter, partial [Gammaproteobacteria bacterium]|nr:DMT family transporter [Gammaproteobacteria bacterium]
MSPIVLAVLWMSGALLSFLTMALSGRELSAEISLFQIVFLRNLVCMIILCVLLTRYGWELTRTERLARHVGRNVVHFAAQYGWFYAVASIPIATVFAIEFTAPIWTVLLASLFLGERINRARVAAIVLGFAGVLLILRPGTEGIHPAALSALGAALGYATTYVVTKNLVATERPLTILFWMNLVQLPLGLVPSIPLWVTPSPALWPWVLAVGVAGLTSHYCLTRALAHADASVVVPLDFLRLPLAAVVAWML